MTENTLRVKEYLDGFGIGDRVHEFEAGATATVPLAAATIGCKEAQIAKTMSFKGKDGHVILVVTAGDGKVNSGKFKRAFGCKATMLKGEEVSELTGHPIAGVCPFALPNNVNVYLDVSMKRFQRMYPACGSTASMVPVNLQELEQTSGAKDWVDVCKGWQEEE